MRQILKPLTRRFAAIAPSQQASLSDQIILVDQQDNPMGHASKKECKLSSAERVAHLLTFIEDNPLTPHRAFSVFLFNSRNQLLLQRRAFSKITFPGYWANTCCSHPLFTKEEADMDDDMGVRRAAAKRLNAELGIRGVLPEEVHVAQKVIYKARYDKIWGEYERTDFCTMFAI